MTRKFKIMNYSRFGGRRSERDISDAFGRVEPIALKKLLIILAEKDFFNRDELEQLIDGDCYIEEVENDQQH